MNEEKKREIQLHLTALILKHNIQLFIPLKLSRFFNLCFICMEPCSNFGFIFNKFSSVSSRFTFFILLQKTKVLPGY